MSNEQSQFIRHTNVAKILRWRANSLLHSTLSEGNHILKGTDPPSVAMAF